MKIKLKYLKYLIFIFICISCSNDDENEKEFEIPNQMEIKEEWNQLIIGKWKYIQQCEFGIQGGGCNESPSTNHYTFKSESIVLFDSFNNNCEEGVYTVNERTLSFSFECINLEFDAGIHFLSNELLILTYTGDDSSIYRVYERVDN